MTTTSETRTPAQEMRDAARTLRIDRQLHDDLIAPLSHLLDFLSGVSGFHTERGSEANSLQDEYVLAVARAVNGKEA